MPQSAPCVLNEKAGELVLTRYIPELEGNK